MEAVGVCVRQEKGQAGLEERRRETQASGPKDGPTRVCGRRR